MKLRIIVEFWGINRRSGEYGVKKIDEVVFNVSKKQKIYIEKGDRTFIVDDVNEQKITLSIHYENSMYDQSWTIDKGESKFYRPRSFDAGYQYRFFYED